MTVEASISMMVDFHAARSCATTCQCSGSVSLVIVDVSVHPASPIPARHAPNSKPNFHVTIEIARELEL